MCNADTEIDWKAYMEEVGEASGFLSGERNYNNLRGCTGPLVYPAGFVYIYSAIYYLTNAGTNIRLAQYIFLCVHLVFASILMAVYHKTKRVSRGGIALRPCYILIC